MSRLMEREGLDYRPHGFRATFRTWVEEQTDTPFEVAEAVLGHVVEGEVARAYQRSDRLQKRRDLLEKWTKFAPSKLDQEAELPENSETSNPKQHI